MGEKQSLRGFPDGELAGQEILLKKEWDWGGEHLVIPSIYLCEEGIQVVLCTQVEAGRLWDFLGKHEDWKKRGMPEEEVDELLESSPLALSWTASLEANGRKLECSSISGGGWAPEPEDEEGEKGKLREEINKASDPFVEYFGLDQETGWSIQRVLFPWQEGISRETLIRRMSLHLVPYPVTRTAGVFRTPCQEREISIRHPVTGREYVLNLLRWTKEQLSEDAFQDPENPEARERGIEFPRYYTQMEYTVTPKLFGEEIQIRDRRPSDHPREKDKKGASKYAAGAIGYFFASKSKSTARTAVSSLHFEPVDSVEWNVQFLVKDRKETEISLIGESSDQTIICSVQAEKEKRPKQ